MLRVFKAALLLLISVNCFCQGLYINEYSANNKSVIKSSDGRFYDWIEIYNSGDAPINLSGLYLSDNKSFPYKWIFPSVTIVGKGFLIVFASDLDTVFANGEIHTNFTIKKEGEPILLVGTNGILDQIEATFPVADVSYGHQPDGIGKLKYFPKPTPGLSNLAKGYWGYCPPVNFSEKAGFYANPIELNLNTDLVGGEIRYTTDGSDPSITSELYTQSIQIYDRTSSANTISLIPTADSSLWCPPSGKVEKATVIKARVYKDGYLPGDVVTNTYFVNDKIFSRFNFPVISISTNQAYLFDYDKGMYVPGRIFDQAKAKEPDRPLWQLGANYNQSGKQWEKPCRVEYFEKDGTLGFAIDMAVDVHGNAARFFPHKALNLKFNSDYNSEDHLDYPIFKNLNRNGDGRPLKKFNSLILRAGGNGSSYLRDELAHTLVSTNLKMDRQAYTPSVVFINGEYWGIHNIREKNDLYYFKNHYKVDKDSVSIFQLFYQYDDGDTSSRMNINNLQDAVGKYAAKDNFYQYLNTQMDVSNYIDYYVTELYCNNTDWPGNNYKYWRYTGSGNSNYGQDGRWRWMLYDIDFGFGLINRGSYDFNSLAMATAIGGPIWPNPDESTELFRKLLTNTKINHQFINRFADLLNSNFKEERVVGVIDSLSDVIENEIPMHVNRWHYPTSYQAWKDDIDTMRIFAINRPSYNRQHIIDYFKLDGLVNVNVEVSNSTFGKVKVNTIIIDQNLSGVTSSIYPWDGIYFKDIPMALEAIPEEGYRFVRWEGSVVSDSVKINLKNSSNSYVTAVFEPKIVSSTINPETSESGMNVFPNPSSGLFSVSVDNNYSGEIEINLNNSLGKEVWKDSYFKQAGVFQRSIYVDSELNGVYILKLKSGDKVYTKKVVIKN